MRKHTMRLYCSRCNHKSRYTQHGVEGAKKLYEAGWRAVGTAAYCPKCVKTWVDRNSQPLADNEWYHIARIMGHMIRDLDSALTYHEENYTKEEDIW